MSLKINSVKAIFPLLRFVWRRHGTTGETRP